MENPSHKLGEEEIKIIINKALDEKERIKTLQSLYGTSWKDNPYRKSRVYKILVSAGIIEVKKVIKKESKHLKRPEEPLESFQMDFTQKRIGI